MQPILIIMQNDKHFTWQIDAKIAEIAAATRHVVERRINAPESTKMVVRQWFSWLRHSPTQFRSNIHNVFLAPFVLIVQIDHCGCARKHTKGATRPPAHMRTGISGRYVFCTLRKKPLSKSFVFHSFLSSFWESRLIYHNADFPYHFASVLPQSLLGDVHNNGDFNVSHIRTQNTVHHRVVHRVLSIIWSSSSFLLVLRLHYACQNSVVLKYACIILHKLRLPNLQLCRLYLLPKL